MAFKAVHSTPQIPNRNKPYFLDNQKIRPFKMVTEKYTKQKQRRRKTKCGVSPNFGVSDPNNLFTQSIRSTHIKFEVSSFKTLAG